MLTLLDLLMQLKIKVVQESLHWLHVNLPSVYYSFYINSMRAQAQGARFINIAFVQYSCNSTLKLA